MKAQKAKISKMKPGLELLNFIWDKGQNGPFLATCRGGPHGRSPEDVKVQKPKRKSKEAKMKARRPKWKKMKAQNAKMKEIKTQKGKMKGNKGPKT